MTTLEVEPKVQPLPYRHRRLTFTFLLVLFVAVLPFLYLYATGYRFNFGGETNLVSTGGLYIGADRTDVSIFLDDKLVDDTRVFRRAYYIQSLEPATHRVTVQKKGHHTWVKELPVYAHLVTEAEAFNLPFFPPIRIVSSWQTATGTTVLFAEPVTPTTTNAIQVATTSASMSVAKLETLYESDPEFMLLLELFATTSATSSESFVEQVTNQIEDLLTATTTATSSEEMATTTKEWREVRLYESGDDLFARWIGSRESMPYYYCADEFPAYSSTTEEADLLKVVAETLPANTAELVHPVQTVPEDVICDPVIQIHTQFQEVRSFDFFPGSSDLIVFALEDGVYVIEVDNRAWQNIQPLMEGEDLDMRVENGQIYVYDGDLIYQLMLEY